MHHNLPSIVVSSIDEGPSSRDINLLVPLMVTQLAWSHKGWRTMPSLRQPTSPVDRNIYSKTTIDIESGEVQKQQHTQPHQSHKRPYTPGASPREILFSQSKMASPSQHSPHGSRFMEGYRRRMRQASLNLPSDTLLDEDLGYPPVCSPPPEVFCGSVGDNRMRNRSSSDAEPAMLGFRRLSSGSNGGNNTSGSVGCSGGLLVFFPNSPSSSNNNRRQESNTDETAEMAINWSNSQENEEEVNEEMEGVDNISMKSIESVNAQLKATLKRPPDLDDTSNSNSGSGSGNGSSGSSSAAGFSPRPRPLFVDTQMANCGETSKRRSPVTQVVDFVRGRNRTYSLQLSGSPLSPQTVPGRSRASCDTQPMISPGRRQTVSGRMHRASFTAGSYGIKSFDSGLDLTSPTINHTALLIKERVAIDQLRAATPNQGSGNPEDIL